MVPFYEDIFRVEDCGNRLMRSAVSAKELNLYVLTKYIAAPSTNRDRSSALIINL